jgi:hypothetical protein
MLQSLLEGERNHMVALTAAGVMMLQMSLFIHTMRLESFAIALLSLHAFWKCSCPGAIIYSCTAATHTSETVTNPDMDRWASCPLGVTTNAFFPLRIRFTASIIVLDCSMHPTAVLDKSSERVAAANHCTITSMRRAPPTFHYP